ncbi:hypothetical protein CYLTODRAFT_287801 [Cylindrobasidium torrendii FP15055 ss-10]|uniref:Uncharacterized protein n=1 Tax=Cylindrobasidium torrendii FP15055 ss-10 TaxID=1314674 RepID=A0A0D7BBL0_9AGAR|nr:hypothetical protein CYLTODRAFT_287801 [Cylindrobasidium torrendii FP15055 ss-10]
MPGTSHAARIAYNGYEENFCTSHSTDTLARCLANILELTFAIQELYQIIRDYQFSSDIEEPEQLLELIEVARTTLLRVGVRIQMNGPCMPQYKGEKDSYFALIRLLKQKQRLFPPSSRDRLARLTLPLAATVLMRRSSRSSTNSSRENQHRARCSSGASTSGGSTGDIDGELMPPPRGIPSPRKPRRATTCGTSMVFPDQHQGGTAHSATHSEGNEMSEASSESHKFFLRPGLKKFGIGSTSMFRPQR